MGLQKHKPQGYQEGLKSSNRYSLLCSGTVAGKINYYCAFSYILSKCCSCKQLPYKVSGNLLEIFQNLADLENQGSKQHKLLQLLNRIPLVTKGIIDIIKGCAGEELGFRSSPFPGVYLEWKVVLVPQGLSRSWRKLSH